MEFQTRCEQFIYLCSFGSWRLLNTVTAGRIISVFHQQSGRAQNLSAVHWLMVAPPLLGNVIIIMHGFRTAHNKIIVLPSRGVTASCCFLPRRLVASPVIIFRPLMRCRMFVYVQQVSIRRATRNQGAESSSKNEMNQINGREFYFCSREEE